jgi:hypothetical protein
MLSELGDHDDPVGISLPDEDPAHYMFETMWAMFLTELPGLSNAKSLEKLKEITKTFFFGGALSVMSLGRKFSQLSPEEGTKKMDDLFDELLRAKNED